MLADRTKTKPRNGAEEVELNKDDEYEARRDDRILVRDRVADVRHPGEQPDLDVRDAGEIRRRARGAVELVVEIAREPEREDVQSHPGHDLIAAEMDGGDGVDPSEDGAGGDSHEQRYDDAV